MHFVCTSDALALIQCLAGCDPSGPAAPIIVDALSTNAQVLADHAKVCTAMFFTI